MPADRSINIRTNADLTGAEAVRQKMAEIVALVEKLEGKGVGIPGGGPAPTAPAGLGPVAMAQHTAAVSRMAVGQTSAPEQMGVFQHMAALLTRKGGSGQPIVAGPQGSGMPSAAALLTYLQTALPQIDPALHAQGLVGAQGTPSAGNAGARPWSPPHASPAAAPHGQAARSTPSAGWPPISTGGPEWTSRPSTVDWVAAQAHAAVRTPYVGGAGSQPRTRTVLVRPEGVSDDNWATIQAAHDQYRNAMGSPATPPAIKLPSRLPGLTGKSRRWTTALPGSSAYVEDWFKAAGHADVQATLPEFVRGEYASASESYRKGDMGAAQRFYQEWGTPQNQEQQMAQAFEAALRMAGLTASQVQQTQVVGSSPASRRFFTAMGRKAAFEQMPPQAQLEYQQARAAYLAGNDAAPQAFADRWGGQVNPVPPTAETSGFTGSMLAGGAGVATALFQRALPFVAPAAAADYLVGQVSQGTSTFTPQAQAFSDLTKTVGTAGQSLTAFQAAVTKTTAAMGYTAQTQTQIVTALASAMGAVGTPALGGVAGTVAAFARGAGLPPQSVSQMVAMTTTQGVTATPGMPGSAGSQMTPAKWLSLMSSATAAGGMEGRMGEVMTGFLQLVQQVEQSGVFAPSGRQIASLQSTLSATGIQGLMGTRGAQVLGNLASGISNPATNMGQMLELQALGYGKKGGPTYFQALSEEQSNPYALMGPVAKKLLAMPHGALSFGKNGMPSASLAQLGALLAGSIGGVSIPQAEAFLFSMRHGVHTVSPFNGPPEASTLLGELDSATTPSQLTAVQDRIKGLPQSARMGSFAQQVQATQQYLAAHPNSIMSVQDQADAAKAVKARQTALLVGPPSRALGHAFNDLGPFGGAAAAISAGIGGTWALRKAASAGVRLGRSLFGKGAPSAATGEAEAAAGSEVAAGGADIGGAAADVAVAGGTMAGLSWLPPAAVGAGLIALTPGHAPRRTSGGPLSQFWNWLNTDPFASPTAAALHAEAVKGAASPTHAAIRALAHHVASSPSHATLRALTLHDSQHAAATTDAATTATTVPSGAQALSETIRSMTIDALTIQQMTLPQSVQQMLSAAGGASTATGGFRYASLVTGQGTPTGIGAPTGAGTTGTGGSGGPNLSAVPPYFAKAFSKAGVPSWIAAGIEAFEGNVAPNKWNADTGGTTSTGPLQLNSGGQGAGYSASYLAAHPNLQAQLGVPPIAKAYAAGERQGLTGENLFLYTLGHSGHPDYNGLSSPDQQRAMAIWSRMASSLTKIERRGRTPPAAAQVI